MIVSRCAVKRDRGKRPHQLLLASPACTPELAESVTVVVAPTPGPRERVPEFWTVDQDARIFERWRPDDNEPEVSSDVMTWQPLPGAPALSIPLGEFFTRANR